MINEEGWLILGEEELIKQGGKKKIGHVTLNKGRPGRVAGELWYYENKWMVNSKSGRYSGNYSSVNAAIYLKVAIEAVSSKSVQRSGKGFRAQCPAHGGGDRNLYITDGEKRLVVVCHSHHCDPKDVVEAVGLSISDLFYESLTLSQKHKKKRTKNKRQIESECVHAYLVLIQLPVMKRNGIAPTEKDVDAINDALAVIERYDFTDDNYLAIERKRQEEVDERRVLECDRALDDAYDLFLLSGADYAERS